MTHAAGFEQAFAELVLERDQRGGGGSDDANGDLYSLPEILSAVRRVCLSRAAVPVLCGSSLRGIGVEPLLDSVSTFLPSPLDRPRPSGVLREPASRSGGGGGGKKRRRGEGAGVRAAGGAGAARTEEGGAIFEVDPLQDDLVAFVFKVRWVESGFFVLFFGCVGGFGEQGWIVSVGLACQSPQRRCQPHQRQRKAKARAALFCRRPLGSHSLRSSSPSLHLPSAFFLECL